MSTVLADVWWWPAGTGLWGNTFFVADISLRVIMFVVIVSHRKRPVPTTLAWLVLVLAVPFLGSFLYLLVGEIRLGSRRLREYKVLTTEVEPLAIAKWWEQKLIAKGQVSKEGIFDSVAKDATALGGFPPLLGNRLELIGDTDELLRRIARDIDAATSYVQLQFYIWMDGGLASEVVEALIRAAKRGVDCKVLADSLGSKSFMRGDAPRRLRQAGVQVYEALPTGLLRTLASRIDLRNHRKIVVIDGKAAYCGSQNLTDTTYHFRKRKHLGPWIDASVRLEGPAVQALAVTFLRDWAMEEDEPVHLESRYFPVAYDPKSLEGAVVQVVPTSPRPDVAAMRESVLLAIYAARRELVITTPYFVPDEATMAALTSAARRGVSTTIVVPRVIDSRMVAWAAQSHFQQLLDAGVRVMWFHAGMLHSKAMTVDGEFSMIGSANIDMRSFWLNFEVTLFVYDAAFAGELRALQEGYIQQSQRIESGAWQKRSRATRMMEGVFRLFGAVM
jgi:cardiolipin synthase A/B